MALMTDERRAPEDTYHRPVHRFDEPRLTVALAVAALASAGAGLVHAAAAGSHASDATLAITFALTAAVQFGWAVAAFANPTREVARTGIMLGVVAFGAWAMSRTTGIPLLGAMGSPDSVGVQDTLAAVLAAASGGAAAWSVAGRSMPVVPRRSPSLAAMAVGVLAVAVPGMAVPHDHDHGHDDGHAHGAAGDDHGHDGHAEEEPIKSVDDPRLTPTQREAAVELIDETRSSMREKFPDLAAVQAAGYISINDAHTGYEHFVNYSHVHDPTILDPETIEAIVTQIHPDGSQEVVSAMYLLPPGQTMADTPEIAGELTTWHDHDDLCWDVVVVTGVMDENGRCETGRPRPTPPMLHVWMTDDQPCGPFSGIEGHPDACHAHDH